MCICMFATNPEILGPFWAELGLQASIEVGVAQLETHRYSAPDGPRISGLMVNLC